MFAGFWKEESPKRYNTEITSNVVSPASMFDEIFFNIYAVI